LAQWKGRRTFFHMVVSEFESTNRGQSMKGRRWPGVPAYYSEELLVESNFQQEPRAQYILDYASPWLNGKVEEPSFIWWSQNLNPLIEDSCRKGRRWPGMPAHYSQELLVESNFQREPQRSIQIGSCLALAQWKGTRTFFPYGGLII